MGSDRGAGVGRCCLGREVEWKAGVETREVGFVRYLVDGWKKLVQGR